MGNGLAAKDVAPSVKRRFHFKLGHRAKRARWAFLIIAAVLLISLSASDVLAGKGDPKAGRKTYQRLCLPCHGMTGKGDGPIGLSLNPTPKDLPEELREEGEEFFFKIIQEGGHAVGKSHCMPAWGNQLKTNNIWDVISHVRALAEDQ